MALKKDRNGRFRRMNGGFASKAEIRNAKKYQTPSGQWRDARSGKRTKAPAPAPTRAGRLGRALSRRDRRTRTRDLTRLRRPDSPARGSFQFRPGRSQPFPSVAEQLGLAPGAIHSRADLGTLLEAEGRLTDSATFSVDDPTGDFEAGELSLLDGVRSAIAGFDLSQPCALRVSVTADGAAGEIEGTYTVILQGDPADDEAVGGVLGAVLAILGEEGYYASDGGADGDRDPAENVTVTIEVYAIG